MSKFFDNVPAEFEQYNPDNEYALLDEYNTYDENDQLHSYDDKPSSVARTGRSTMIYWHSHGEISRKNNLPPFLFFAQDAYFTLNSKGEEHSYNGNPSRLTYVSHNDSWTSVWSKNGESHREGDLPAFLRIANNIVMEEGYYENGVGHRASNRKSNCSPVKDLWEVKGYLHNELGYAEVFKNSLPAMKTWSLYGVMMIEEDFNSIKTFQHERGVPLWLAFLSAIKVVTDPKIGLLLDETNNISELPFQWTLRILGITEETFSKHITKLFKTPKFRPTLFSLKDFEEIVKFNNQNMEVYA